VEANALCNAVTGGNYSTANGVGAVAAPYMVWTGEAWALKTTGVVSPMQNLTCNR
jgi:hypothetical protein